MSSFLIQIIAKSNLATTLLTDEQAMQKQNRALAENAVLNTAASASTSKATNSVNRDTVARAANKKVLENQGSGITKVLKWLFHLDGAQSKVGYNIAGFSIRVGAWFMPLMGMMYLSMLPVIGALLAMGSAAVVAAGGLVGVLGVGALLMYRRNNKSGGGYAGARRPYADAASENPLDMFMNPVWGALDTATLSNGTSASKYAVEQAEIFFKNDLPGAIKSFLRGVDKSAMDTIMTMFRTWLPGAMTGLARWGSQLFKLIGPGSLSRLNNLFKWLAGGIMGLAVWMESTDWRYIDQVTDLLADVSSTLMHVGKEALPVFSAALSEVWPRPLKPLLEALGELFDAAGKNESALKVVSGLASILVTFMTFRYLAGLMASLVGIKATIMIAMVGAAYALYMGIGVVAGSIILGGLRLLSGLLIFGLQVANTMGNIVKMIFMAMLDAANQMIGNEDNMFNGWRNIDVLNDDWMSGNFGVGPDAMKTWSEQFDDMYNRTKGKDKQQVELVIHTNDEHIVQVISDNVSVTESPVTAPTRGTGRPNLMLG